MSDEQYEVLCESLGVWKRGTVCTRPRREISYDDYGFVGEECASCHWYPWMDVPDDDAEANPKWQDDHHIPLPDAASPVTLWKFIQALRARGIVVVHLLSGEIQLCFPSEARERDPIEASDVLHAALALGREG